QYFCLQIDPRKVDISRLESLPQDLLGIIVSKVVDASTDDYINCILSCKELGASADDKRILQKLNLAPLVKKPLLSIQYVPLMKKTLAKNNLDAHYIKGIIRYFLLTNSVTGLHHLGVSANAGKLEVIYLYAIILCRGRVVEGKKYLNKLKWTEDTTLVNNCWKKIKISLHGIRVARKRCYLTSLRHMKPTATFCHLKDMKTTCGRCFYYKQMYKFIFMI
ncbi:PREDICTED: F-box protein At2g35280-like, partial [Camelina sativa]|uniref:F-box protein At2g35280-like n=1 Tax=Camelina sativa TaxID=90675 RepID=A0ABM1RKZ7_CAMSA